MIVTVSEIQSLPCIVLKFAPRRLPPRRPRAWPRVVATVLAFALLLGFYFVVREIKHQGEQRRLAVAEHAGATWRCKALPTRVQRASCLAELDAPAGKALVVQLAAGRSER